MSEAYRRLGHHLKLEPYPFERALLLAKSGELDGDLVRALPELELQLPNQIRLPVSIG